MNPFEAATLKLLSSCSLHEVICIQMDVFEQNTGKLPQLVVLDKKLLPSALREFEFLDNPEFRDAKHVRLYIADTRVMFAVLPDGEYAHVFGAQYDNKLVL